MGLSEVSVRGLLQLSFCRVSLLSCFDVLPGLADLQCAVCISLESAYQHLSNQFSRDRRSDLFAERSSQLSVVAEWWCCSLTLPLAYIWLRFFRRASLQLSHFFRLLHSLVIRELGERYFSSQWALSARGMVIQLSSLAKCQLRNRTQPYTAMPAATFADDFGYFSREQRSVHFG